MDIKKIIEDIAAKIKEDEDLQKQFLSDPVQALKTLTGIDIPTEQVEGIVAGVKAKLTADDLGDALKGLGGLFKK